MSSKTETKNNRSLSYRLASRFTAWLIFSHIVASTMLFFILQQGVREKDRKIVSSRYEEVALLLEKNNLDNLQKKLNQHDELLVRILDRDNQIVYGRLPRALKNFDIKDIEDAISEAQGHNGFRTIKPVLIGEETIEMLAGNSSNYRLIVGINTDDSEDFLHLFIKAAVIAVILASLSGLLFGYIYAKQAMKPVRGLIRTIQRIRSGETKNLATVSGAHDELSELTELFNGMIVQINLLIQSLQQSLDAIAHDLRTPITHLLNRFENFLKSGKTTADVDFIHECLKETQRISSLVTTLLELTEAQAGSTRILKTPFSLRPLLLECTELYEYVAEDKEATMEVFCDNNIVLDADRSRLKRAFANLIDNSLKYSDKGAQIRILVHKKDNAVVLRFEDTGWGIAQSDLHKVWERLYRGDSSRSTQGMGLGLSFVKSIIELHEGHITIESREKQGTVFEITLPSSEA